VNATGFLDFAAKVAAAYSDPAGCRSAISRAYYGAFHVARAFLDGLGVRPPRSANAHIFVQQRLANCGNSDAVEAGWLLADLYADPLNADYDLSKTAVESIAYARARVVIATRIQTALQNCESKEVREEIKRGMVDYERKIAGG
jgi:uncharacterized protein (UPF0332 family)